jgi:two-component system cell cycle response regulator
MHISTGGEMSDESGKKQRLLIVDDSRVIRVTARKILQDHFETVEAVDGENAWELLNNADPFSLIVSDLTMPNLDGFGLLKRIRSAHLPQIKDLPVIIITGANDSEATKERATQAGATDFIGKPFDSVHLLARTQAHASAHTTTQTLTEENIGLEERVLTDPLTGLANEAAFLERGYQQLSYAVRHETSLAVFRVEIDDFSNLYKQHGKNISESIIKSVATLLQSNIRHEDMAARVGTARFTLLLPGMNTTGIRNLADRINRNISERILKQGESRIRYTVSIGVAAPGIRRDTRFDDLLSIADSRLVYATAQGGNQVVYEGSGPAVQAPARIAVPLLLEESITEMINLSVEAEKQCEDINIVGTGSQTEKHNITLDEVPVVESRAAQEPDDIPRMFAGPIPELTMPPGTDITQVANRMDAAPGRATFRLDDEADEEETIVITAPLNIFNKPDEALSATEQMETSAAEDDAPELESPADVYTAPCNSGGGSTLPEIANATLSAETDETAALSRPGIFRRLLSFLFRRSRQPG